MKRASLLKCYQGGESMTCGKFEEFGGTNQQALVRCVHNASLKEDRRESDDCWLISGDTGTTPA